MTNEEEKEMNFGHVDPVRPRAGNPAQKFKGADRELTHCQVRHFFESILEKFSSQKNFSTRKLF